MTNESPAPLRAPIPRLPYQESALAGTVSVASFPDYDAAAGAVARLAGTGFPIGQVTIVGCDLRLVDETTGWWAPGRAVKLAAAGGAWFGALVAVLLGVFDGSFGTFLRLLLWGLVFGALFGAAVGWLALGVVDRGRGFTSRRLVVARRYDLQAPRELTGAVRERLLAHRPADMRLIDGTPAGGQIL